MKREEAMSQYVEKLLENIKQEEKEEDVFLTEEEYQEGKLEKVKLSFAL